MSTESCRSLQNCYIGTGALPPMSHIDVNILSLRGLMLCVGSIRTKHKTHRARLLNACLRKPNVMLKSIAIITTAGRKQITRPLNQQTPKRIEVVTNIEHVT